MKHIVYLSDLNMGGADSSEEAVARSGYANIAMELCRGLAKDYEVMVMGLGYTGQEFDEKFHIVPCSSMQDMVGVTNNLKFMWLDETREPGNGVDVVICALDIHVFQEQIFPHIKKLSIPYICITPLESDPLCITWANLLREMDKVFFISQFGTDEAIKAGVKAEHIEVGIDTKSWRLRTKEEYDKVRSALSIEPEDFVVMTVADNQERKAIGRGFQIAAALKDKGVQVKHILVTREHSQVGWKLYDLAYEVLIPSDDHEDGYKPISLSSELRVFQNGIPFKDLYTLYCAADAYLCCSKGEGLGIPIMEAMCVGVPVVANRTGAIPELLADGRGWIVDWRDWYYDPFGNQRRYDIDIDKAVEALLYVNANDNEGIIARARAFMEARHWDKPVKQVADAIEKIVNGT